MEPMDEPAGRPIGRRAFLGIVGLGLSSLVWGEPALRALNGLTSSLPQGVQSAIPALGGGWRIYAVNPPFPTFDPATWKLRIDGLVRRPVDLTYDQLRALPRAEQVSDFHCVTGWSVDSVHWAGVRTDDASAEAETAMMRADQAMYQRKTARRQPPVASHEAARADADEDYAS